MNNYRRQIAMVIGSGSVKCAASIGMWKVFQQENLDVSMSVGCSGGSIYAAIIALGYSEQLAEEETKNLWTCELFGGYAANLRSVMPGEIRFTEKSGLIDAEPIYERLKVVLGDKTFSDTLIPLYIIATDLYTGESVTITEGSILDAVRASIAIPMVFPAWEVNGQLLMDGAVSNPIPVDVAIKEGGEIIAAMGFELPTRDRLRSYTALTNHFNSIYMNNILRSSYAFHNVVHHSEIIPILPQFDRKIGSFDVQHIPYIIEQGVQTTYDQIPYIQRLMQ
ncbi:MAG: patatin-like phospholipase family protein [Anaerolineales bacterium]|nr:patatin-like phospholipase family protein [Anaerolineales bacterium]